MPGRLLVCWDELHVEAQSEKPSPVVELSLLGGGLLIQDAVDVLERDARLSGEFGLRHS